MNWLMSNIRGQKKEEKKKDDVPIVTLLRADIEGRTLKQVLRAKFDGEQKKNVVDTLWAKGLLLGCREWFPAVDDWEEQWSQVWLVQGQRWAANADLYMGYVKVLDRAKVLFPTCFEEAPKNVVPAVQADGNAVPPPPPPVVVVAAVRPTVDAEAQQKQQQAMRPVVLCGVQLTRIDLWLIFRYLTPLDLVAASQVCQAFYVVSRDDALWEYWCGQKSPVLEALKSPSLRALGSGQFLSATGKAKRRYANSFGVLYRRVVEYRDRVTCLNCYQTPSESQTNLRAHKFLLCLSGSRAPLYGPGAGARWLCEKCTRSGIKCSNCGRVQPVDRDWLRSVCERDCAMCPQCDRAFRLF